MNREGWGVGWGVVREVGRGLTVVVWWWVVVKESLVLVLGGRGPRV